MTEYSKKYLELLNSKRDELYSFFAPYGVKNISIFGSVATGDANENSDIDILLEDMKPVGLLQFGRIINETQKILGVKVDLVPKYRLKPNRVNLYTKGAIRL